MRAPHQAARPMHGLEFKMHHTYYIVQLYIIRMRKTHKYTEYPECKYGTMCNHARESAPSSIRAASDRVPLVRSASGGRPGVGPGRKRHRSGWHFAGRPRDDGAGSQAVRLRH